MSYRYEDNTRLIEEKRKVQTSFALLYAINDIHREANKHTPMEFGLLRADVTKTVRGKQGKIKWGRKYAAAQEAGRMTVYKTRTFRTSKGNWVTLKPGVYRFRNYTTPGTGAHFAQNAVQKVTGNPLKYYRQAGAI